MRYGVQYIDKKNGTNKKTVFKKSCFKIETDCSLMTSTKRFIKITIGILMYSNQTSN